MSHIGPATAFPDDDDLRRRISDALASRLSAYRSWSCIERRPSTHRGETYRAECVRLSGLDGDLLLFAKHGPVVESEHSFRGGHIGGLAYEAAAHECAYSVEGNGVATPYGTAPGSNGTMSFFTSYIEGPSLYRSRPHLDALVAAATWLGDFQRRWGVSPDTGAKRNHVDAPFVAQWLDRTSRTVEAASGDRATLAAVATAFAEDVDILGAVPNVLIHGDCYTSNGFLTGRGVLFVDWEMAALGPGEIDLATLTLGWPEAEVAACVEAYHAARWPSGGPEEAGRVFLAARRYVLLRTLSIPPSPDREKRIRRRIALLRQLLD